MREPKDYLDGLHSVGRNKLLDIIAEVQHEAFNAGIKACQDDVKSSFVILVSRFERLKLWKNGTEQGKKR